MKIVIHAADLDNARIDGTRVYLSNLMKHFGKLDKNTDFLIFHKNQFNPELAPPLFPNYQITAKSFPFCWTQTRFAYEIWKHKPDALWMPMHNIPFLRRKKTKVTVTILDLAFKYFPATFPKKKLWEINLLTGLAVTHSDKIIAISESSKRDILKFYPEVREDKIRVIYLGFDADVFSVARNLEEEARLKKQFNIRGDYILYTGALQPRKNLEVLVDAFGRFKKQTDAKIQLVLAGEKAWMWNGLLAKINNSIFRNDILLTGQVKFSDIGHLNRGAKLYVFPSLYEGFGITPLEAFASDVPVICAHNSSLPEVCGDAARFFEAADAGQLAKEIQEVLSNENLRQEMIEKGRQRIKKFSWEKCARETLDFIMS